MQYIVVFSGLVTIIVGLIAAYQFIKSIQHPITRRPGAILGVIAVIMIVFTVVLANSPLSREGGLLNPTPGTDQLSVTTTVTQQIPSPTSTPTPVPPTPKPTSVAPGTVLYQENGSDNWQGWAVSSPWKIVSSNGKNLLINQGGGTDTTPSAISPLNLSGVQNFAIEANILVPQPWHAQSGFFMPVLDSSAACQHKKRGTREECIIMPMTLAVMQVFLPQTQIIH